MWGMKYLSGVDAPVAPDQIKAIVVSSMNEQASQYSTSRSDINRLWLNSVWSAQQHPRPVERLGTARTGIDIHDSAHTVLVTAQHVAP